VAHAHVVQGDEEAVLAVVGHEVGQGVRVARAGFHDLDEHVVRIDAALLDLVEQEGGAGHVGVDGVSVHIEGQDEALVLLVDGGEGLQGLAAAQTVQLQQAAGLVGHAEQLLRGDVLSRRRAARQSLHAEQCLAFDGDQGVKGRADPLAFDDLLDRDGFRCVFHGAGGYEQEPGQSCKVLDLRCFGINDAIRV